MSFDSKKYIHENRNFCTAPWTHTYLSPQSERRLCCASRESNSFVKQYIDIKNETDSEKIEEYRPKTLEDHWNSPHMQRIRKKMLANESIPECVICQSQELHLNTYRDYFTKDLFPHLIEEIIKNTDEDGKTTLKPRSYDYRFTNACNFKCRMCGDLLSSSWEQEKRAHDLWSPENDPWMEVTINREIKKFQKDIAEKEFIDALKNGEVEEIYWVGGEPLLWELHWEQMKMLVDTGLSKKVFCRYNTNLYNIEWRGINLFDDLLVHFKGYQICASIDAPGKIGEYIRTGLDWDRWIKNFQHGVKYIKEDGTNEIFFDLTLTLPGLFGLVELCKYATALNVNIYPKLVYAFDSGVLLSPLALPRDILEDYIDDLINDINKLQNPRMNHVIRLLENLKTRETFQEKYEDYIDGFERGKLHLNRLEKIRGDYDSDGLTIREIFAANKKVLNWWDNGYT